MHLKIILIITACIFQANAWKKIRYDMNLAEEHFKEFVQTYNKHYRSGDEYKERFEIFKRNLIDINKRNNCTGSEYYGITKFTDMTNNEFTMYYTGFKQAPNNLTSDAIRLGSMSSVPDSWDWRQMGAVGPAEDQGPCGSCWAFSAVGVVEGQYGKKNKIVIPLSKQQPLDCSSNDNGCLGGWPHTAFEDMARLGGWQSEEQYPYQGGVGVCRSNQANNVVTSISGGMQQKTSTEEKLRDLVYSYGPVSISIYVENGFSQYRGGLATAVQLGCNQQQIPNNHAVVIVGYGSERGKPYWIIKNSYGPNWGEQGFMRLERGTNACNILEYAAVAHLA